MAGVLNPQRTKLRYTFASPPPWAHQRKALARIHALDGKLLLDMPMRTGKSRVAIDWAGIAYHNYGLRRVVIVCPISVLEVWRDQINEMCPVPSAVRILDGTTKQRIFAIDTLRELPDTGMIEWIIVNHESIWRGMAVDGPRGGKHKRTVVDALVDWQPDLVVIDESHRIKSAPAKQSKAAYALGLAARYRLALTGTPITKRPLDIFGQYRYLDDQIFLAENGKPMSWTNFKHEYAVWGGPNNVILKGYRHLPELIRIIHAHSYRVKLEDCFDLPPKTYIDVPVAMPARTREIYRQMAKEMIAELDSGVEIPAKVVLDKLMKLSQITSGFINEPGAIPAADEPDMRKRTITHQLDEAKLLVALDMINDFRAAGEKVVVFCRFREDYHRLARALTTAGERRALGPGFVSLTGETPAQERGANIKRFQTDPDCTVFIGQTQAGSLGIDLTAARMLVFYSLDYNWATYAQAQERVGGPLQKRPVTIHHLVVPRTIDQVVLRVLKANGDLAHQVMHDPKRLLDGWAEPTDEEWGA